MKLNLVLPSQQQRENLPEKFLMELIAHCDPTKSPFPLESLAKYSAVTLLNIDTQL